MTREEYLALQREYDRKKQIARNTNLVALAAHFGHSVIQVGHFYSVKDMDSIRIYNQKTWSRFSNGSGGDAIAWMTDIENFSFQEALDYLVKFNGYSLDDRSIKETETVHGVSRGSSITPQSFPGAPGKASVVPEQERREFKAPEKARYQSRLYAYLGKERGLEKDTIKYFERMGLIYISQRFFNVVFLSLDAQGIPRHAAMRSTDAEHPFKGDASGSDKKYGFNLFREKSDTVVVTEAAIDLMSYFQLAGDFESSLLALGGTADNPLEQYLKDHPQIKKIKLLLDADAPGSEATKKLSEKYTARGFLVEDFRPAQLAEWECKDMNELLNHIPFHPEYHPGMFFSSSDQEKMDEKNMEAMSSAPMTAQMQTSPAVKTEQRQQNQKEKAVPAVPEICLHALYQLYQKMDQMSADQTTPAAAWEEVIHSSGKLYDLAQSQGWNPKEYGEHLEKGVESKKEQENERQSYADEKPAEKPGPSHIKKRRI